LLAAGVWAGFANATFIVVIAALNGIAMGFDMPARQALTVEMTSREDLLNAISLNSSIVNGARVIGPSLAGLMIGTVGVAACFLFNGLSFIAVIAGLLMMRLPKFERNVDILSALGFLFVAGFGMLLFFSTTNTVLQTIVPDDMRGRVMGLWSLIFGAMIPLGSLEAGAVAHWLGTSFALALGAIVCAVSALVTLIVIRRREAALARLSD
jgi:MFS family permease